ncbi:DUF2388 domain-containing protein [Pseudomonas sp. LRF_L74]|uniref:DUF2388 domain-containing protein n=1 Tax=Pseudomonas sp. LRF_L74 TaxID=3369422 RepID=UPI003F5F1CF9
MKAATLVATLLFAWAIQPALGRDFLGFPDFDQEPLEASTFYPIFTTIGIVVSPIVSTQLTIDEMRYKLVLARDDAASFVASNGEIRGAFLQAALLALRERPEHAADSDLRLAQVILAMPP